MLDISEGWWSFGCLCLVRVWIHLTSSPFQMAHASFLGVPRVQKKKSASSLWCFCGVRMWTTLSTPWKWSTKLIFCFNTPQVNGNGGHLNAFRQQICPPPEVPWLKIFLRVGGARRIGKLYWCNLSPRSRPPPVAKKSLWSGHFRTAILYKIKACLPLMSSAPLLIRDRI